MSEYARWIEIDRVMNEGIYQNALRLTGAIESCASSPSPEKVEPLVKCFADVNTGVREWEKSIEGKQELAEVSQSAKKNLSDLDKTITNYRKALEALELAQMFDLSNAAS